MVEMQVGIDDDVDIFGSDPAGSQIRQQLRRLAVELDHAI